MTLKTRLLLLCDLLIRRGHIQEAKALERASHYIPEEIEGVPSFWRRNYDYGSEGDSFYYGDMSEKPSLKEWREKHKGKGPEMPKKKKPKKKEAQTILTKVVSQP